MFNLKLKTDNAAFEDKAEEVARILREVAERIAEGYDSGRCADANGNTVGHWTLN